MPIAHATNASLCGDPQRAMCIETKVGHLSASQSVSRTVPGAYLIPLNGDDPAARKPKPHPVAARVTSQPQNIRATRELDARHVTDAAVASDSKQSLILIRDPDVARRVFTNGVNDPSGNPGLSRKPSVLYR